MSFVISITSEPPVTIVTEMLPVELFAIECPYSSRHISPAVCKANIGTLARAIEILPLVDQLILLIEAFYNNCVYLNNKVTIIDL